LKLALSRKFVSVKTAKIGLSFSQLICELFWLANLCVRFEDEEALPASNLTETARTFEESSLQEIWVLFYISTEIV